MIVFTHRPSPHGWTFHSDAWDLDGGGKTLEASMASSEHAARHCLSLEQGYPVLPEDACHQVEHVVTRS